MRKDPVCLLEEQWGGRAAAAELSRREGGRRGQITQGPLSHGKEVGFYLEELQCLKQGRAMI